MRAAEAKLTAWQGHAPLRTLVRLRVQEGVRAVLTAAIDDPVWDFAAAEQPFGARKPVDGAWDVLDVRGAEGALRLRGTVDRVDLAHDRSAVRVIDYKRSKSTVLSSARSLGETALQVPLYASVASRATGLPATGLYMPTQARDVAREPKTHARSDCRMSELVGKNAVVGITPIEAASLHLITKVRRGDLVPVPARESECRFCSVSGGCRKPRFAMAPAEEVDDAGS